MVSEIILNLPGDGLCGPVYLGLIPISGLITIFLLLPPVSLASIPMFGDVKSCQIKVYRCVFLSNHRIRIWVISSIFHFYIPIPYSSKHLLRLYLELFFGVYINTFSEAIWSTRDISLSHFLIVFPYIYVYNIHVYNMYIICIYVYNIH